MSGSLQLYFKTLMSSGLTHDKAIKVLTIPLFGIGSLLTGPQNGLLLGTFFLIGGLWLSPDLDTVSTTLGRWGPLKIIWWPYRKSIPHRSIFSHSPFLGNIIKISYLIMILLLLNEITKFLGLEYTFFSVEIGREIISKYPEKIKLMLIGIETSTWVHLLLDSDP